MSLRRKRPSDSVNSESSSNSMGPQMQLDTAENSVLHVHSNPRRKRPRISNRALMISENSGLDPNIRVDTSPLSGQVSNSQNKDMCSSSAGSYGGQAAFQRTLIGNIVQYEDFGDKTYECTFCGALFWLNEAIERTTVTNAPIFSLCCLRGKLKLPLHKPTPPLLDNLLDVRNGVRSVVFRENIRAYNSMFALSSLGAKVDHSVNNVPGPYIFKISGQVYHLMGSLLPPPGECPKFAQLYVYDTYHEAKNRLNAVNCNERNENLDQIIVEALIEMLDETNELVKVFRTARDRCEANTLNEMKMRLLGREINDNKQYEEPTSDEIGGLIVGDIGLNDSNRDIIVECQCRELQRISNLHPKYMALQYPLLFPYGEDGFILGLQWSSSYEGPQPKREKVPMRAFIVYYLQHRKPELTTLLKGGRLFQQYLVDAYAIVEENRLDYIKRNQNKLRSDSYKGIYEAIAKGDTHADNIGQKIILPSSFTGSSRYMLNNYQDAMAICRHFGNPDLFITFTCNVKWPEIVRELNTIPGYKAEDRPDLVSRVFKMKLNDMIQYIKSGKVFGEVQAEVCTIEFQKRGLPHCHMLVWLHQSFKCFSAQDINSIISAEIPDKLQHPELYNIVDQFMIHGPCGILNSRSPCMKSGKCTKYFPKPYVSETVYEVNSFPIYMRRDNPDNYVIRNGVKIDNSFVVPYNAALLLRYNAHINVECCSQSMLIKYLFKYITKGPDRARMILENKAENEVLAYLNCRYLSPYECVWRLFEYPIHSRHPAVHMLPIHLPYEQAVVFSADQSLESIANQEDIKHTQLTSWFKANSIFPEARSLSYAEFPTMFVWEAKAKVWKKREQCFAIGRIAYVHPASGELYYLRMLLHLRKGAVNFEALKIVDGVQYATYQEACESLGLLGNDKEWIDALADVVDIASSKQLRQLFVTLLLYCDLANPTSVFESHWQYMCDDILYTQRQLFNMPKLILPQHELRNCVLCELQQLLNAASSSLEHFGLPLPDQRSLVEFRNRLIREELSYEAQSLRAEHDRLISQLNAEQKIVYDAVIDAVFNKKPGVFFVHGHGGTGKTFLWHTILCKIRAENRIVLAMASSGIASLLLPGGRTAHSRFKIPLSVTESSLCYVKKGSDVAKLLEKTELIIWDEAPMMHRHCFEALDKTLCDLLLPSSMSDQHIPFGGKPVLLGGDFRQILPVVPGGTRDQIINASLNSSPLWPSFKLYTLTENMRLSRPGLSLLEKQEVSAFANWILKVGNGQFLDYPDPDDQEAFWIEIPNQLLIDSFTNPIAAIFFATYPNFGQNFANFDYLRERAIVTPTNAIVTEINNFAVEMVPGEARHYLSFDSIASSSSENSTNLHFLYPVEFLNQLEFSGMPVHCLTLKIGMPIMLLQNLNQSAGLCNGTRLIITQLADRVLEAKILTGSNIGDKVLIPRIVLTTTENKWPFIFKRRQFPVRPCYAMTINKSQGQSLKQVGLFLSQPVFTHGQLYVALSRVTSKQGLKVLVVNNDLFPDNFVKNIVFKDVLQQFC